MQDTAQAEQHEHVRQRMSEKLREGLFENREIEITVREKQAIPIIGMMGPDQVDPGFASVLENILPERSHRRRVTVARARAILLEEETDKLIDNEKTIEQAIERTEQTGIIFLDEMDKIAAPGDAKTGSADVSRQGVQRDLLPIVEGSAVNTRYGVVHTDQILFIAAGAFHSAAVSDLMPELQGRFPIRVELATPASFSLMRWTRSLPRAMRRPDQPTSAARGFSAIFCRSLKVQPSTPATAWCTRTRSYSSRPEHFIVLR